MEKFLKSSHRPGHVHRLIPVLFMAFCLVLIQVQASLAQESANAPEQSGATADKLDPGSGDVEMAVELPDRRELAASLSDSDSRQDALLSLTALAYLLKAHPVPEAGQEELLVTFFRDNRTWLDRLAGRYPRLTARSTVLDPAALLLQEELWQHRLLPTPLVAALGPDYPDLLPLLFDRSDERMAASFLPEVLFRVEHSAANIWIEATQLAANNPVLNSAMGQLDADWFEPWTAAEPPTRASKEDKPANLDAHFDSLQVLLDSVTLSAPPDYLRTKRLIFDLHRALPELKGTELRSAQQLIRLTLAVDGLHDGHFLEFSQSLLWIAMDMLDSRAREEPTDSRMAGILAAYLPRLSTHMARSFSDVDSRINANLAAVFDVAQDLQSGEPVTPRIEGLQQELGDAVAQLVLLAPDMGYYFDQPVRRQVREETNICISMMADRDDEGRPKLTREQFDGCMAAIVDYSDNLLRSAELSGDQNGPFALDQLARELELLPAQRINYLLGYLYDQAATPCPAITEPLPNPLDWSTLTALMSWFAMQAPVFMQTPENEARIQRMQDIGSNLMRVMSQQLDCLSGSGTGSGDPVSQVLAEYRAALEGLVGGIRESELEFREMRLLPGADVVLNGDANQTTSYRTEGLTIGPCNTENSCEMTQPLEATRALIGLFPDAYLLAHQTRMGELEICYDNISWVERRAEHVRPEDENVADYYGKLSFDLKGRFKEGEEVRDIFGATFVSPKEHNYLLAAASDEVLNDPCPVEWVGTQIVTPRTKEEGFMIVPNRLTYLASSRSRPSELMNANWSKGEEWRDQFITGLGVRPIEFETDRTIYDRLGQHLNALYQDEQRAIYGGMLRSSPGPAEEDFRMLNVLLDRVTTFKALLQAKLILFYPETILDSDEIRGMLAGQGGLLDEAIIRRFRSSNAATSEIHLAGLARLDRFHALWKQTPESVVRSGSVPVSMAHAMARLNYIDQVYFSAPLENSLATPVATQPERDISGTAVPEGN